MVNNTTNINERSNHLSPQTNKSLHMALEIHVLSRNRNNMWRGLNRLIGCIKEEFEDAKG